MRAWKTDVPDAGIHTDTLVKGYEAGKTPTQFLREGGYLETVRTTPRLSEAEVARNVLVLQQSGMSVKRIAAELNRSRTWVYAHLKLAKAGIASCREL